MRVLISAYACEPGKGSEPGVGWSWVQELSKYHELWVLTREANRKSIEAFPGEPNHNIHWIYYDLPGYLKFWKRGNRGVHLYYVLWQLGALCKARDYAKKVRFDLAHHITFVNFWLPTLLPFLGLPYVWGPLGGGETTPEIFMSKLSISSQIKERTRNLVRWLSRISPLMIMTARKASSVIATSAETKRELELMGAKNIHLISQIAMTQSEVEQLNQYQPAAHKQFRFISVGNLLHWKGFDLGLKAFSSLIEEGVEAEYWVVGDGPEKKKLMNLAAGMDAPGNVKFFGQLPRREAIRKIAESDVMVFPSMHDSGGWVCAEAMALGKPVICLDIGGPGYQVTEKTGFKIKPVSYEQVVGDISSAMRGVMRDKTTRDRMAEAGRDRVARLTDWSLKSKKILAIYESIGRGASLNSDQMR